ncbi:MAG: choice-of-anchor D domain-containing protein [Myxococcaceae bacterium]
MNVRPLPLLLLAASGFLGCGKAKPNIEPYVRDKGLYAEPRRLAFVCVTPGCISTQTVRVSLVGDRRVAIKRIILSAEAGDDFTLTPSQAAPFILGVNSDFTIEVHYEPKGSPTAKSIDVLITYTDASAVESPDRIEPGELSVPLVRRLVGEPVLSATPAKLSYGVVAPGTTKTEPIHLANIGFGNVAVDIASVDAGHPELSSVIPAGLALVPDAGIDLPLTWSPAAPGYLKTTVLVTPANEDVDPAVVEVEGTSLSDPRIGLEPATDVDFGDVPKNQQRTVVRQLVNQGGSDLYIQNITVTDTSGNVTAGLPDGGTSLVLSPLQRVPLKVSLVGTTPAELNATVKVASSDSSTPFLNVQVLGTVTEPKLQLTPATVDFGPVPVGWVLSKPVELRNVGYGPLTLKNVSLVSGTSSLFTLKNLPSLPSVLERDQRLAIEVEFRAETAAAFAGFISVESDDPAKPFSEVPLAATSGSCTASCPITNGTPTCASGVCAVGSCNTSWYDTDKLASTGCECREVGTDPGAFCASGHYAGNLRDGDGPQVNFNGILPIDGDIDIIKFHAEDASQWFSDDFNVNIRLVSSDPNIKMCVYRYDTTSHLSDCYFANEVCANSYHKGGSLGSSDDADFTIKVYRNPGMAPTCTQYTLSMSNG